MTNATTSISAMLDSQQSDVIGVSSPRRLSTIVRRIPLLSTGGGLKRHAASAGIRRTDESESDGDSEEEDWEPSPSGDEEGDSTASDCVLLERGYAGGRNQSGDVWAAARGARPGTPIGSGRVMSVDYGRESDAIEYHAGRAGDLVPELPRAGRTGSKKQKRGPTAVGDDSSILVWEAGMWKVTPSVCDCAKCLCQGSIASLVGRLLRANGRCNRGYDAGLRIARRTNAHPYGQI